MAVPVAPEGPVGPVARQGPLYLLFLLVPVDPVGRQGPVDRQDPVAPEIRPTQLRPEDR